MLLHALSYLFTGYGTYVTKPFFAGDYLLTYQGELVTAQEGEEREEGYGSGVFLYFFQSCGKKYW
jgi:hypothetical protein